jgi:hypothetical protein
MKRKVIWVGLLVLLLAVGCSDFTKNAYRTLTVSYQSYDVTLSTMGDLYREGKVTEAQKEKAIELGRVYKLAHNEAVTTLASYEENGGQESKDAYLKASGEAAAALAKLLSYVRPIIEKGGK